VALVTTAKYFLPRMLGEFCRRYPGVDIDLEIADRERIVARLRGNQDDLYVMVYPPEDVELRLLPVSRQRAGGDRSARSLGRRALRSNCRR
jgi:DNA-binding transcriptional LysR family regulator